MFFLVYKVAVAERLGVKRLNVKSFEEIMEEKRQRKSQRNVEGQDTESANDQKITEFNPKVNKAKIVHPPKGLCAVAYHWSTNSVVCSIVNYIPWLECLAYSITLITVVFCDSAIINKVKKKTC